MHTITASELEELMEGMEQTAAAPGRREYQMKGPGGELQEWLDMTPAAGGGRRVRHQVCSYPYGIQGRMEGNMRVFYVD